jgi:hypothetical protein
MTTDQFVVVRKSEVSAKRDGAGRPQNRGTSFAIAGAKPKFGENGASGRLDHRANLLQLGGKSAACARPPGGKPRESPPGDRSASTSSGSRLPVCARQLGDRRIVFFGELPALRVLGRIGHKRLSGRMFAPSSPSKCRCRSHLLHNNAGLVRQDRRQRHRLGGHRCHCIPTPKRNLPPPCNSCSLPSVVEAATPTAGNPQR